MSLSMPKLMPAPRVKEAPRFKGEYLKDFLDEFEILAKAAGISDAEHCDYLTHYCCCDKSGFDHKRFIKGLKEYLETDWKKLKTRLTKCYPPEEEEFSARMKPEVVIQTPKPKSYIDVPVPPKILKCTEELLKKEIPSEDVEMKDDFRPSASKQKATDLSTPMLATMKETPMSTGVKPKSKHIEFHEPSEKGNYSES